MKILFVVLALFFSSLAGAQADSSGVGYTVSKGSDSRIRIVTNATTNAVDNLFIVGHNSTGTVADNFGSGIAYYLQSSTTAMQLAATQKIFWSAAAHATRTSKYILSLVNSAATTDVLTITGAGNGTFLGTLAASNLSGTNTGDQTITLTGHVTGSGTGSFATTIASGVVTNAMLAGSIAYSKLLLTGAILNADLAGSIDLTTKVTGVLPVANGGELRNTAATTATTGTMTVTMNTRFVTITPTGACTFNGNGGITGQTTTFVITTSGTSSFTLTWSANYRATGTLATGTTTAKKFCVTFLCLDGTTWLEVARTAAM